MFILNPLFYKDLRAHFFSLIINMRVKVEYLEDAGGDDLHCLAVPQVVANVFFDHLIAPLARADFTLALILHLLFVFLADVYGYLPACTIATHQGGERILGK